MKKTATTISLQPAHVKAYHFIEKYIEKNIVSPEYNEISKGIKFTIRHTYRIIDELSMLGYLERTKNKSRSIVLLKPLR